MGDFSPQTIYLGITWYCTLLFSLVFHEFGHAWTALRCGDPTAKQLGRVTLNPAAHVDPIGTVLFPLIQIFSGVPLIGWAKPVPFDRHQLRNPRRDSVLVAIAGPGFNLILVAATAILLRLNETFLGGMTGETAVTLHTFLLFILPKLQAINLMLALFNMIPLPPLDGSYLVEHLLPGPLAARYRMFGMRWGFMLVLLLVFSGAVSKFLNVGFMLATPVLRAIAGN